MSFDVLSEGCVGIAPLTARLERWQRALCADGGDLSAALEAHGSPVNVLDVAALERNASELAQAAIGAGVELELFFARKANKALAFVDEARRLGLGIDLASERELAQCLERDVPGSALMMTAAIKPPTLLELCVANAVTVAIDNADELRATTSAARSVGVAARLALRLAPAIPGKSPTRFGMSARDAIAAARSLRSDEATVCGVHFHLDGYAIADRAAAIEQALAVVDALIADGHQPTFLDIGGGIPMSYLDSGKEWEQFWHAHEAGLADGQGDSLTFDRHELARVYPAHQSPIRGEWLSAVLASEMAGGTVAAALGDRGLALRCEPGRCLLDGCGLTAARVVFRKQRADGTWLIGLAMNRTQCRSAADDFLVDPLLVSRGGDADRTPRIEAFLVGAYCIEGELLTWRRLRFPSGVAVGDIVVFPNTAGYLMHILESSSHQIPLARNLVRATNGALTLDPIDAV